MRSVPEHTVNFSTRNNWSPVRRMPPTTTLVVTTPSAKRSLTWFSTESENWLTNVPVFKVSWSFTLSVVVRDLDSLPCWWNVCPSISVRSPSWNLPSTLLHKSQQLLSSHTTPSWPLTPLWNTPTVPSWSTMKLSTISAVAIWTLSDQPTQTWIVWLDKSSPRSPLHSVSMVLWMLIWLSSKPIWFHTHVSISRWLHTPRSSPLRRPTTNNLLLLRSPTLASNHPTKWSNVIHDTENTWPAVCCTVVMSSPRMSTLPLLPSRPNVPFNSSIGAQQDSKSESTTNHQLSYQEVIWLKCNALSACCRTQQLLLRLGLVLITNSIWCTPNVLSFTGMSEKVRRLCYPYHYNFLDRYSICSYKWKLKFKLYLILSFLCLSHFKSL